MKELLLFLLLLLSLSLLLLLLLENSVFCQTKMSISDSRIQFSRKPWKNVLLCSFSVFLMTSHICAVYPPLNHTHTVTLHTNRTCSISPHMCLKFSTSTFTNDHSVFYTNRHTWQRYPQYNIFKVSSFPDHWQFS